MGSSWQTFSTPSPPERGAFPLDIEKKCRELVLAYNACLRAEKGVGMGCRPLARRYLECRMAENLMEKDSLVNLGFQETEASGAQRKAGTAAQAEGAKAFKASANMGT